MTDIQYPVECPLMHKKIDMGTCFDIHMVVRPGGVAPLWTAPQEILETQNYEKVCNNCKYHRND